MIIFLHETVKVIPIQMLDKTRLADPLNRWVTWSRVSFFFGAETGRSWGCSLQ